MPATDCIIETPEEPDTPGTEEKKSTEAPMNKLESHLLKDTLKATGSSARTPDPA
jgi:hypothetical protein